MAASKLSSVSTISAPKLSRYSVKCWTIMSGATCWKKHNVLQPKPKMTDELKSPCRLSGTSCLQNILTRCWRASSNCTAYIAVIANGGQSKHLQQLCPSPSLHPYLITNKPALSEPPTDYRWRLRSERRKMGLSWLKQHNFVNNFVIFKYSQFKTWWRSVCFIVQPLCKISWKKFSCSAEISTKVAVGLLFMFTLYSGTPAKIINCLP